MLKNFNKKLGNWALKQFETYLQYKAEEHEKMGVLVTPKYTSQRCSKCGHIHRSNRNGSTFKCKKCNFELHADLNASRNIVELGKAEVDRLVANQPIVATRDALQEADVSHKPTNALVGN